MDLIKKLSLELVKKTFQKKGYKYFSNGYYNLNIFGIRNANPETGLFDDLICVSYSDSDGEKMHTYEGTTDSGAYYMENPINKGKGAAILVPDQYLGAYKIGLHRGKQHALVQLKPLRVYRDANRDKIMDFDPETIENGIFGINIHNSGITDRIQVGKWSAGCQALRHPNDWKIFMKLVDTAAKTYGNIFSYTLFNESDF